MRQGNKQDYVSDGFGDCDGTADLTGAEESLHPPVVRTSGDCAVVELIGEIDLLAFQRMAPLVDTVAAGPYRVVAIDLTGTTFFDCSGLSLLVRAHRRAVEHGGRVTVVCRHRLTLRIIELAGLTEALRPVATLEEALR
ncbi:STAS domain-containing protein [Streptomyces kunmingensis]|uniref:Anti-sigma factor antagonist n=1 Tax=Streptomyces kunmingensis TaxID=68225 RepID=A0ABU6C8R4_9ACTN|nr:STAS domain-containing protein [Streptomyces kunmingensis]MEB3960245.1 STAS domain-containing protein [Streptomyces kunmingensis]